MRKLLASLLIVALLSPEMALATYSGYGTNTPYDSTGGIKITSETIKSGTIKHTATKKKKKTVKHKASKKSSKKKHAVKSARQHKSGKAHKTRTAKQGPRGDRIFKDHTIAPKGELLPPVQVPGTGQ